MKNQALFSLKDKNNKSVVCCNLLGALRVNLSWSLTAHSKVIYLALYVLSEVKLLQTGRCVGSLGGELSIFCLLNWC